ncbi:hypothetical protein GCM10027267_14810 [Paramicrobacterium agarici]
MKSCATFSDSDIDAVGSFGVGDAEGDAGTELDGVAVGAVSAAAHPHKVSTAAAMTAVRLNRRVRVIVVMIAGGDGRRQAWRAGATLGSIAAASRAGGRPCQAWRRRITKEHDDVIVPFALT